MRFRILDYIIHNLTNVLTIMGTLNQTKGKQAICNFEPTSWITTTLVCCHSKEGGELGITPNVGCK
jgi:hypothetical protein